MIQKPCINLSQSVTHRGSHPDVLCKKGVLRIFVKFTGKNLRQSLFFNKVAGQKIDSGAAYNFIKKETLAQVFSFEFYEISNNTFFIEHLRWLLLNLLRSALQVKQQVSEAVVRRFLKIS